MKISLIANFAYGALTGEETGHIGGVERQAALFSEWLSQQGHDVSVITWDEGDADRAGDVRIIKLCRQEDGIPGLRFFVPRWSSLVRALRKADADIYYQNCAEYVTGQVAMWCHQNARLFVYSVASDADCDYSLPNLQHWRARSLFRYGLKNADLVITQTHSQRKTLNENYGIEARVIRMPGTPPVYNEKYTDQSRFDLQKIIWVARIHPVKRVHWIIDIARNLPQYSFEIIGPLDESQPDARLIEGQLSDTRNVDYVGKVKRSEMPDYYQQASILCCTSLYEGFPNTYLEAWSYGIPVVTTIDPDNLIMSRGLGYASATIDGLIEGIRDLLENRSEWQVHSANARQYYRENHRLHPIQQQFEDHLSKLYEYGTTRDHFEHESQQWSDYYLDQPRSISHLDVQGRLKYVSQILSKKDWCRKHRILDLGCGTGDAITIIPEFKKPDLVSADYSLGMVQRTTANFEESTGVVADACSLPFADDEFDCVLALGLYEYIEKSEDAIAESCRVIKPNGEVIMSIPNKRSLFRKLRTIEDFVIRPFKVLSQLVFDSRPSRIYYHQQWHPDWIVNAIERHGLEVREIRYCTYGFLSPKLAASKLNMALCVFMNEKMGSYPLLQRYLANTVVIHGLLSHRSSKP